MGKSLICLDDDLASSIALRFAAEHGRRTRGRLQVFHVEEPDRKAEPGTGWVRRSWEQGLIMAGLDKMSRLIHTEEVELHYAGPPKVVVGQKDEEVLKELHREIYDLYIEGYLNTSDPEDFYRFLSSTRFQKVSCPVMLVKNLVPLSNLVLLAGEAVPLDVLLRCLSMVYAGFSGKLEVALLYYRFSEEEGLLFQDHREAGTYLEKAEEKLSTAGWKDVKYQVVQGRPEEAAAHLRNYGPVISTSPARRSPRAELLALLSNPLLLGKAASFRIPKES